MALSKKLVLLILAILIILLIALLAFWFLKPSTSYAPSSQPGTSSKKEATSAAFPDDTTLIKSALSQKTGIPEENLVMVINQKSATHAKGLVNAKGEEVGGGYFLAVKVDENWVIAFDGQSTPGCDMVDPYQFPAGMVPECLDSSGNPMPR